MKKVFFPGKIFFSVCVCLLQFSVSGQFQQEGSKLTGTTRAGAFAGFAFGTLPTALINGGGEVCPNTPAAISFTGANSVAPYTFSYQVNAGPVQTITTISGNAVDLPVPTSQAGTFTYTLTAVSDSNSNSQSQSGSVTVTVNPAFLAPGPIAGPTNVCNLVGTGEAASYSISALAGATDYIWNVSPTMTIVSGQGTPSISVTINSGFIASANKRVTVRVVSTCGTSPDRIFYLVAQPPGTPGQISGPTNACPFLNSLTPAIYSIAPVPGATSYEWTSQAGTTIMGHPNGPGVNDVSVTLNFLGAFTTSSISVRAINNCGISQFRSLTIQRNPLPALSPITGPSNVCSFVSPNAGANFSVPVVTGARSYAWTAPPNSIVTHPNGPGLNDTIITVQFPAGFTSGNITVTASGPCGTTNTRTIPVRIFQPGAPGAITAMAADTCPLRTFIYSLPGLPSNTTSIEWTVPNSGTILAGQGTAAITVSYPPTSITGSVTARAVNVCSNSATRVLAIALAECGPDTPPPPPPEPFSRKPAANSTSTDGLTVRVSPNPSAGDFQLRVYSTVITTVAAQLTDMQGKRILNFTSRPFQTLNFGNNLKPGTYILDIRQGDEVRRMQVIKL